MSDTADVRKALATWVGYLGEIGVRELSLREPGPSEPRPSDPGASLAALRDEIGDCRRCKLCEGRTNIVFGVGDPKAKLMFVGEGPGADEDAQGEPFVGRAGKKLNDMIRAIGLERKDVYIANIVKCRPPGNRAPLPDEAKVCLPYLLRQIRAIRPEIVCTLGATALNFLLGVEEKITRVRGTWRERDGVPVLPTYHPAFILRDADREAEVFGDFDAIASRLRLPPAK